MRVIDCPECAVPMQPFFVTGTPPVELDRCPKCTRLWFDVKELERAVGKAFLPRLRGAEASHTCPVDKVTMGTSLIRGDVPIEECGTCGGAMLDSHDFEQISGAPLRQVKPGAPAAPPPAPPPKKKARAKTVETPKVVEFVCARCRTLTPVSQAANLNGATVCRDCGLKPWPNQPAWYNRGSDPLSDFLSSLFDGLFR